MFLVLLAGFELGSLMMSSDIESAVLAIEPPHYPHATCKIPSLQAAPEKRQSSDLFDGNIFCNIHVSTSLCIRSQYNCVDI